MTLQLSGRAMLIGIRASHFARRPSQTRQLLTLSSVEGPRDPPLERRTLSVYFRDEILAKHAERPALVCRQERPRVHGGPPSPNMRVGTHLAWDFWEFDRHIHALARGLVSLGVQKGDRVAVVMGNNRCVLAIGPCSVVVFRCRRLTLRHLAVSSYALLQWACASVGAILVTLNPAYRVNELVSVPVCCARAHGVLNGDRRSSTRS